MKFYKYQRAFTLIELLVVIAIISILAAILFPVFAQAKAAAKKTQGLSNIKQITLAHLMYIGDNDDRYLPYVTERTAPVGTPDTAAGRAPYSYRVQLGVYTKSQDVFKDPAAPAWPTPGPGKWYTTDYGNNHNESHLANAAFQAAYAATTGTVTITVGSATYPVPALNDFGFNEDVTQSSLAKPANFILIGDAARASGIPSRGGLYPQPFAFDDSAQPDSGQQARLIGRHTAGKSNIGYADGHAKSTTIKATWRSYADNDWRRNPSGN